MTAIVTQERAKATWLTALAGLLLLAAAFALMVAAAPEHPHSRPHAVVTTTSRAQAFLLTAVSPPRSADRAGPPLRAGCGAPPRSAARP
jgi:hypothetical protein